MFFNTYKSVSNKEFSTLHNNQYILLEQSVYDKELSTLLTNQYTLIDQSGKVKWIS